MLKRLFILFISLFFLSSFAQEDDLSQAESESFIMGLASQYIDEMSKTNAFSVYTPEEMRVIIRQKSRGKFMEKVFFSIPKLEDFAANWLVDESALPKFLSIIKQRERLKNVGVILVVIFILGYIISSYRLRKEKSWLRRISYGFIHSLVISITGFVFFYFSFRPELSDTLEIAKQTLF